MTDKRKRAYRGRKRFLKASQWRSGTCEGRQGGNQDCIVRTSNCSVALKNPETG